MLRTISVSNHIQVQGMFVRALSNENIVVSTGSYELKEGI